MYALWLWGKGRGFPSAHLASQGASGGSCSCVGASVRYFDQGRNVWNFDSDQLPLFVGQSLGRYDSGNRCLHDGSRSSACFVFRRFKAYIGLFFGVTDRIYFGRSRNVRSAGGGKCPCRKRKHSSYGESLPDQAGIIYGGRRGVYECA